MTQQTNKDYSKFSFEDFLQDDFFIDSVKQPTQETSVFWETYRQKNAGQMAEFDAAYRFVKDACKEQLLDEEIADMWIKIKPGAQRRSIHPTWYIGVAVAACVVVLLVFRPFANHAPHPDSSHVPDIISFAGEHREAGNNVTEAQLILSDDKTILLTDKESVIKYDSTAIRVSEKEVSKEESATFNQLIIPRGKRSMLTLYDGTQIWVNAGTRVVYPVEFEKDKREIYVDGEVYLDVAPDKHRPFIIRTTDFDIQVLGTKFNLQAYASDEQKRVALESGSVKIVSKNNNNEVVLSPDKMYEYDKGKETVESVDIRKYISWVDGVYLYESEQLDVILARLSRYYGKDIEADQASAKLRCSGKLDLKDQLDEVLNGLAYTAPITYTQVNGKYNIKIRKH